jgi:hypothetical protein
MTMRLPLMLILLAAPQLALAEEKKTPKDDVGLELKVILKNDTIEWDADEKSRAEFKASLEKQLKRMPPERIVVPPLTPFEATVQVKNTSTSAVTILVAGDQHILTFDLKGPGVVALSPPRAATREFRVGRSVTLEAGEKFEIPIHKLCDGFRMMTRDIFWTDLGEYTLSATYRLGLGGKEVVLKSEPVKFKVEGKK